MEKWEQGKMKTPSSFPRRSVVFLLEMWIMNLSKEIVMIEFRILNLRLSCNVMFRVYLCNYFLRICRRHIDRTQWQSPRATLLSLYVHRWFRKRGEKLSQIFHLFRHVKIDRISNDLNSSIAHFILHKIPQISFQFPVHFHHQFSVEKWRPSFFYFPFLSTSISP